MSTPGDFVGRARELGVLRTALAATREGRAPVVVVHGEPGIGKTRTVAEFANLARAEGETVLWGTCYQGAVTYPYGPWLQAIGGYVDEIEPERIAAVLGADAGVLANFVPSIGRRLPDVPAAAALPHDQRRMRLYEAVVRFLEAVEGSPALVLDDLQWADGDTLELLVHVARFAPRPLIVATYRGVELDLSSPVTTRLAEISRHRASEYLLLSSLPLDEATALLERVMNDRVGPELLDAMYTESGGNPFYLGELGRHIQRHGSGPTALGWRMPETIRQAVALRLAGLSAEARRMLELAAVFAAGFGFQDLSALTELDEETLLDCLDEALAAEVIQPIAPERYDFSHTLVRHTLYDGFSASRRARLHRRLAGALERTHAGDLEGIAAELARQYYASATLPGADRGVQHALIAARLARAVPAPAETVTFLRIAAELVPPADKAKLADVTAELALAEAEASLLDEAPVTLDEALTLLEATGADAERIAGVVYDVVAVLQDALANQATLEPLIARGLAGIRDDRGLAWARLKLLERPCEIVPAGDVHAARWLGFDAEAVRIARTEGSEADYAQTIALFAPWRLADLEEVVPRVLSLRDPVVRLRGLNVLAWNVTVTRWSGLIPPAERLVAEIERLGEELDLLPARTMAAVFRGAILGAQGDFDGSRESLARAKPGVVQLAPDHRIAVVALLVDELTAQHVMPDWPRMARLTHEIANSRAQVPWFGLAWAGVACHAYARAGMIAAARALLADIAPGIAAAEPWDYAQNCAVSFAGEAVWDLRAVELAEPVLSAAHALIEVGTGDYYMASNELTVARLSAVLGRFDEALEFFARARGTVEERGQRPLRAIVDHDEALTRRWAKETGGAALLASAKAAFAELGMSEWTRRAALLGPPDQELPDGLTPREAEILRLVAAGRSNREIAETLVLSIHTVERHVANAYRKVAVRNRADATAYVMRAEL